MKTAISIQEALYDKATRLARELKVSRSKLFAMALEEFLKAKENEEILARINEAHSKTPSREERTYQNRMKKYHGKLVEGEW